MLPAWTRAGSVLAGYRSWSAGPMELARHRDVTVVSEQGLHCSKAVPPADWSAVARNSFRFHVLDRRQSCHAAAKVQPAREQMTHSCSARVAVACFVLALAALHQAGLETGDSRQALNSGLVHCRFRDLQAAAASGGSRFAAVRSPCLAPDALLQVQSLDWTGSVDPAFPFRAEHHFLADAAARPADRVAVAGEHSVHLQPVPAGRCCFPDPVSCFAAPYLPLAL